jgi:segregation and condensation protein A
MMASQLIYIKSRMLLPPDPTKTPEELEAEDPRRELVYQLLEHQKFKAAAQMLYSKETVELCVWPHPPVEVREDEDDVTTVTLFDLVGAFREIVKQLESRPVLEFEHEQYTIEEKMNELRQLLLLHKSVRFSTFLSRGLTRQHVVVIFLALLEMARQREIRFVQDRPFGEILIRKAKAAAANPQAGEPGESVEGEKQQEN